MFACRKLPKDYITSLLKGESKPKTLGSIADFKLYHKSFKGGVKTSNEPYLPLKELYHKSFKGGVKTLS